VASRLQKLEAGWPLGPKRLKRATSPGFLKTNRVARTIAAGWTIGSIAQYISAPLLGAVGGTLPAPRTGQIVARFEF
jgi:hypothetical protein